MDSADPRYLDARRHVEALKGFYIHLLVFFCVMSGLAAINFVTRTEWWVQWPFLGWGIGVIAHGASVLSPIRLFGREWEERKIQERLRRTSPGQPAPTART